MKTLLSYTGVTIGAVLTALVVASQFMTPAESQMRPPTAQVNPPPVQQQPAAAQQAPVQPAPVFVKPTPQPQATPGTANTSPQNPNPVSVNGVPQSPTELLSEIIENYNYEPAGRRDPFMPYESQVASVAVGPVFPLQKFDIDQLKLVGIIWDVRSPKAMLLDPSGKGYVVGVNERIGRHNGYIAKIREGELIVVETFKNPDGQVSYQTRLMKLVTD